MRDASSRITGLSRAARLRCPRCGLGPLFCGWVRMHESCSSCGLSFTREPGFYLGSIYLNYGFTVILTGSLYALLVLGGDVSSERALAACLVTAVVFPILFFRHARSLLLALDCSVNKDQTSMDEGTEGPPPATDAKPTGTLPAGRLAALASDDGRAGCALGMALALILLFGLGMAAVTLLFLGDGSGSLPLD